MRTTYDESTSATEKTVDVKFNQIEKNKYQSNSIPYHARENSLPFSYGPIGMTSTPLRNISGNNFRLINSKNENLSNENEYNIAVKNLDYGIGYEKYQKGCINNSKTTDGSFESNKFLNNQQYDLEKNVRNCLNEKNTDASSIKTQPRLTSPLLVRKTLANRSPTLGSNLNANTNTSTISNIYTFEKNDAIGYNGGSHDLSYNNDSYKKISDKEKNGCIEYGNMLHNTKYKNLSNGNDNIYGHTARRTPVCDDFEYLLNECREKVFNEYQSTANDKIIKTNTVPPEPPQRQFLPTTRYARNIDNINEPSISKNNYNYDIEFNLNLDEVDFARSPSKSEQNFSHFPLQKHNTHDNGATENTVFTQKFISPLSHLDYNYRKSSLHNTSSAIEKRPYGQNEIKSIPTDTDAMKNIIKEQSINRAKRSLSPLSLQYPQNSIIHNNHNHSMYRIQQQHEEHHLENNDQLPSMNALVGNGYIPGNGNENESINFFNTNTLNRSDLRSSPIYATSTKHVATTQTPTNNNKINIDANNIESDLRISTQKNVRLAENDPINIEYYSNSSNIHTESSTSPYGVRPETPGFPVTPRTPHGNPVSILKQSSLSPQRNESTADISNYNNTIYQNSYRSRLNSNQSMINSEPQEVAAHLVKFAKDSCKFWYKPNISRDEAISLLLNASPGTFLVRDSTTFKNAYGLVLRVAHPPPGLPMNKPDELVRHFLIEPTTRGVRLKGCANEPVFTSLSALVYEHSINQLALPCVLRIPDEDIAPPLTEQTTAQKQLLSQGAACNVLWLFSCDTESLTGEEAIRKSIRQMYAQKHLEKPTEVQFKVSLQGITLTDNTRKKFFRKHYAAEMISFCAIDPDNRLWSYDETGKDDGQNDDDAAKNVNIIGTSKKTIFAFVARRSASSKDNQCHVFCDLAITQPASAIVSFANKILPTEKQKNYML